MAEELKRYINPENPVYFSYAWANAEHPDIEEDVNNLCKLLDDNHIYYKRDKDGLCPYRWSIQKAEKEIGEGTAIIVVISERYLKSLHCMNEWHLIRENGQIWKRVFPIVLGNLKLTDKDTFREYYKIFKDREQILIDQQKEGIIPLTRVETEAANAGFYVNDLKRMYQYLAENNKLNQHELRKDNYAVIIGQLKDFLKETAPTITNTTPLATPTDNSAKVFSISIPDNLLPRDKEVEKLFNGIKENRFFNLIGVGGMGKTSLTYLMLERHKKDFNEIAYVVVNNNIKDAIVAELNSALDLDFKNGMDRYLQLVSYLENNFKATQPNLLVLDINEISDETKDFIKNINKLCPKDWKVLTISRENLDTSEIMATEDFNKNQDIEFLKKLFLKRAGNRYEGFEKFPELFATIFYNPLLAEQLGFFLSKWPEPKSLEAIKEILYADTFKNKDMKGYAVLTNDNRSTVINFLTNLASYDSFDHNEQELLRHFVLWQSDFIPYSVIKELLQGVFESDNILADTLSKLAERSILMVKSSEDGSFSYKLHGLLADSIRGQIDLSKENYLKYNLNIEKIKKFFKQLENKGIILLCILNSSAIMYDIQSTYDPYQYQCVQCVSFIILAKTQNDNETTKDYFKKAIEIGEKLPKDKHEYQSILTETYNTFAKFLEKRLHDYDAAIEYYQKAMVVKESICGNTPSDKDFLAREYVDLAKKLKEKPFEAYDLAKANYQKALEIRKQLPNYHIQLAYTYADCGKFQDDHLQDHDSAERNYRKAINILQKVVKDKESIYNDTPNDKNSLAGEYFALAYRLEEKPLQAYDLAKDYYEKAIAISEQLPKDNPEYQDSLATTYHCLAYLQDNHFQAYDMAIENYEKAIEILEQIPNKQDTLANIYVNFANLQNKHLQDFDSAERYYQKAIDSYQTAINIWKDLPFDDKQFLANHYVDIAHQLSEKPLEAYDLAKETYEEIISIMEQLPKDNPDLAQLYNDFAYLLHNDHFKDFESAKEYCHKAIEIAQRLTEQYWLTEQYYNTKYLIDLLGYKHSLAEICFDNNEIEAAKAILDEIKQPAAKCLADNPNDEYTKRVNDDIADLLEKIKQSSPSSTH